VRERVREREKERERDRERDIQGARAVLWSICVAAVIYKTEATI
jgi:hypothetical protein